MSVNPYTGPIANQSDAMTGLPLDRSAVITACGHLFNKDSLKGWVITHLNCPVQRF